MILGIRRVNNTSANTLPIEWTKQLEQKKKRKTEEKNKISEFIPIKCESI